MAITGAQRDGRGRLQHFEIEGDGALGFGQFRGAHEDGGDGHLPLLRALKV